MKALRPKPYAQKLGYTTTISFSQKKSKILILRVASVCQLHILNVSGNKMLMLSLYET